ncbi:hypothetical protein ILYODFUR_023418 [Ilyodon furcidens]|uniref:Uncharacterized protein n=1 Tax=Ilyodon furcidens TaxID=33524 RepID=A0ABV0VGW4_9TELE
MHCFFGFFCINNPVPTPGRTSRHSNLGHKKEVTNPYATYLDSRCDSVLSRALSILSKKADMRAISVYVSA